VGLHGGYLVFIWGSDGWLLLPHPARVRANILDLTLH
jgi:hypothetical protein